MIRNNNVRGKLKNKTLVEQRKYFIKQIEDITAESNSLNDLQGSAKASFITNTIQHYETELKEVNEELEKIDAAILEKQTIIKLFLEEIQSIKAILKFISDFSPDFKQLAEDAKDSLRFIEKLNAIGGHSVENAAVSKTSQFFKDKNTQPQDDFENTVSFIQNILIKIPSMLDKIKKFCEENLDKQKVNYSKALKQANVHLSLVDGKAQTKADTLFLGLLDVGRNTLKTINEDLNNCERHIIQFNKLQINRYQTSKNTPKLK